MLELLEMALFALTILLIIELPMFLQEKRKHTKILNDIMQRFRSIESKLDKGTSTNNEPPNTEK